MSNIFSENRRLADATSSTLQENKLDAACMYVHVFSCTYSDRHELGLLPCAGGVALCFAVLCCARGSTAYILVHTAVLLFVAAYLVRIYRSRMFVAVKKTMENEDSRCIKCSGTCMLALANSARLLALSSGMHERENSAKHGTARHSTAPV